MDISRRAAMVTALAPFLVTGTSRHDALLPEGLWPVMLTPFNEDKSIDWKALDALTDWYLANGADGLFACCQSSEVWELTEEERIRVSARVAKRSAKTPVVAGGLPGFDPQAVTAFVQQLADKGVRAAVLTTCQLAERAEDDTVWRDRVEAVLNTTKFLPFGLYEAPSPYKRLLTPDTMRWAAQTGRFLFHKDTSCEMPAITAKVKAIDGTPLRLFNAHVPILIDAIRTGGHGFSGIAANAYPNLVSFAVHHQGDQPQKSGLVQKFLTDNEPSLNFRYPLSAKVLAALAGVPIKPVCRRKVAPLNAEQLAKLRALRKSADSLLA
jgi:4-hydroxy-tetrahydrodipicolinate synthase